MCSKCAESEPSSVEIVQPSSPSQTSGLPAVIIGSIAIVMPSESRGPRPRLAEVRDVRVLVVVPADAVADEAPDDREAGALDDGLHGVRDVADPVAEARLGDPGRERVLRDVEQPLRLVASSDPTPKV